MSSIRQFLLISLLAVLCMATVATAWWTYKSIVEEVDVLFDNQLIDTTHMLRRLITHDAIKNYHPEYKGGHIAPPRIASEQSPYTAVIDEPFPFLHHQFAIQRSLQVWREDGSLLLKSSSAPDFPLSFTEGFSEQVIGNQKWRVFSLTEPQYHLRIQVGQLENVRGNLVATIAFILIVPLLVMCPLLALSVWYAVNFAVSQIQVVAEKVKSYQDPDMLIPVDTAHVPSEILPLVHEMNNLFSRLSGAFEREKRFTADAAHEMRTPLAIVKTQAQVALRAKDQETRSKALSNIIFGVNRCSHVMQQLATLNSLKADAQINDLKNINLVDLARTVISDILPDVLEKNSEISLDVDSDNIFAEGNAVALSILFRNLLDNATRYCPRESKIILKIDDNDNECTLTFEDNGPGIPEEMRERVFERFFRQLGNTSPGSGLGLSIVAMIVHLHHAQIRLDQSDRLGGARFTVTLPKCYQKQNRSRERITTKNNK